MALSAGTRLGPYEILEPLGAGGMGEVYRARDEKLDRDVALKVLPEGSLENDEARKRFRKEAHALSRLSHPHIATILDFDTQDGTDYLAMELVRGHSLRDELDARGPLPEKAVVRLGAQIAHGLQAAHEQGVIHRDLKPSNLQLTPDGLVKILDFGLARLVATGPRDDATEPTETAVGRAAGTLPYMSPEQLRGRGVDGRTDLYAVGAVLYELATGRRLFAKESAAELTEAILSEDPKPPREVNDRVPPGLEAVILKALDKDPDLRHQTAKDLLVDLERLQIRSGPRPTGSESTVADTVAQNSRRGLTRWSPGLMALAAVLAGGVWLLRPPAPPRITEIRRLHVDVGPDFGGGYFPTWATDGVRIFYVARHEGRNSLNQVALGGGEPAEISTPFKDIEIHGYLRRQSALVVLVRFEAEASETIAWQVWLVPVPQGSPRPLAGLRAYYAAASPNGEQIALLHGRRLLLTSTDGSDVRELLVLPEGSATPGWVRWSPDGTRLRFVTSGPGGHEAERWVWETTPRGQDPRPLWRGRRGDWTVDGRYFLLESGTSHTTPRIDISAVREGARVPWARSRPVQLTFGPVSFSHAGSLPGGRGLLAFGADRRGEPHRFNRRTRRLEPLIGGQSVEMVAASPDGQWLAWVAFPDGALWRSRPDGSERLQLTSPPERAWIPSWSPDGTRIVFVGERPGAGGGSVRVVSSDGGAVQTMKEAASGSSYWDPCWLPDGQSLIFSDKSAQRPGIEMVDVKTKTATMFDGADDLSHPKCGSQGQILAVRRTEDADRVSVSFLVYWPDRGTWEHLGPASLIFPTWTRDGRSFCGLDRNATLVQCYSLEADRLATMADFRETPLLVGTAGLPWMGLDDDDSPVVILDRSTRDFYALDWEAP